MTNRLVPLVAAVAWCSTAFGSVNLNPGDDIQAAIDNNPEGTTFFLNSGVYRLSTGLTPKSFDIFIGQAGTVLNGSRLLTSWTQEDTRWVIQTPTQHAPVTTLRCSPSSYTGCLYDDAVFYDDQPLWRVMTKDELGPGKVYIDSANDRVYLADDPQDRKVEMATSARALISAKTGVVSVTIQGLIIEKFANAGGEAALEAGADWTILNNEIRFNHGIGLGNGKVIRGNFVHHNGELGMGGGAGSTGVVVEENEISFNNTAGFDWSMEGGATKWFDTTRLTLRGNYVHDNIGPGLWTDGDNIYTTYENNHTRNNAGPGIFHELGFDAVIRNNVVEYDGLGASDISLWWGAGIFLNSSSNVEIYGNTVIYSLNGIGGSSADRGSSPSKGPQYLVQNVYVHHNVIALDSGTAAGFVRDPSVVSSAIFTEWSNRFDYNSYYLTNLNAKAFQWMDAARSSSEWLAYGNDTHGTFLPLAAGTTPPAVSITSPADGAIVYGTVSVTANASASAGISNVEFYVDGKLKAAAASGPWTFNWDSGEDGPGRHTLSVKVYDAAGNTASARIAVTVAASDDTIPPNVNITAPANNSAVSGVVTVSATASDNIGVIRVEFYVDAALAGAKTMEPWDFAWGTGRVAGGTHMLTVVAFDAAGNLDASTVSVTVGGLLDTTRPTVEISSPSDNSTVSGVVAVDANASDDVGVTKVQLYVDGARVAERTDVPWHFAWDATRAAAGPHTLMVVAYDAAGNLEGSVITVTVVEATETTPAWAALGAAVHVRVSPNPWRGTRTPARDIEFDGLPAGSMLEIFALSGRLVKRFPDAGVSVRWNRIMDSRETAPAGVYWYVVTDARGMQTDRGKLLIVK